MAAIDTGAGALPRPTYSAGYRGLVLGLLVTAYTFNFIDRTIIATIGPKIREDLGLSSTQIGLLGGLYFALLYTLLGIPIARLAERFSRTWIITVSLVIWSGFTALCGTAHNFAILAAYRFGVGIGEAGCSPPAHSLISDYYEPKKRATALSIYSFGIPLGAMIGAVAGGWLAENFSWRLAFVLVGLPGVILAVVFRLVVKEPPRGHSDLVGQPVLEADLAAPIEPPAKRGLAGEFSELASVAKSLFGKWPVLHMVLGVTIASFGSYGSGQFVPQFFRAAFDLDLAKVGLITGLVGGISSGIGTLAGGFLTDRLARRSARWYALTPAIGLAIATPIYIFAYLQQSWQAAALVLLIPGIFHYTYLGPTFGVVQNSVDTRRRATATALLFFFLNLLALGGGPPFTGWVIDQLAQVHFAHPEIRGVWAAVVGGFAGLGSGGADFASQCPGGLAPAGAPASLAAACTSALTEASRGGIIVSVCFYLWASAHYFLGAIGLVKHMRERAAAAALPQARA